MSGGFIFAKIDVELRDHEKASQAAEAMATWTWCMLWTRAKERDGFVSKEAIRGSWVGERKAIQHLAKLIEVGLAKVVDGGWELTGYGAKNETKADIDARREDARSRQVKSRTSRVTNGHVTRDNPPPVTRDSQDCSVAETETETETEKRGRPRLVDPELATTFASALLALGHRVALGPFAWKDISSACAVHWPDVTAAERHEKLRAAVTAWARCTDGEETRGWDHRRFIAWANAGNASPPPASKPRQAEPKGEIIDVSEADMAEMLGGLATTYQGKINAS